MNMHLLYHTENRLTRLCPQTIYNVTQGKESLPKHETPCKKKFFMLQLKHEEKDTGGSKRRCPFYNKCEDTIVTSGLVYSLHYLRTVATSVAKAISKDSFS